MPTRYEGSEEEVRGLNAFIKLVRATESVGARLSPLLAEAGLSTSQFGALEALLHLGPLCQRDLAAKLLKSSGNITMVVDNLVKDGLVRRERSGEDRRYVTIHLTEKGRERIEGIFPRHAAAIVREMSVLTPEEQEQLGCLCRRLGRQDRERER